MKIKKEYLILAVVIAALAAYLYQRTADRTHYTLPKLPALAAGDITRVQMTRGAETVTLARQDMPTGAEVRPLVPGMQLEADVPIERRRLFEWLFAPVIGVAGRV